MASSSSANKAAVFLFFLLTVVILFLILFSGIDHAVDPVSLLPHDTVVLIDVKKPAETINKLRKSKLGIQVNSIEWQEVLQDIGIQEEDVQELLLLADELETFIRGPFFNELFASRVLLGLLPAESSDLEMTRERIGIDKMMVLMARPRHRASLVDFFAGFALDEFEQTEESYKGRKIKTFVREGGYRFSTTVTDGIVIASFSPQLVKRCIDNALNNITSGGAGLQGNVHYRELKKQARGHDDQFVYIDILELNSMIENNTQASVYPPHSGSNTTFFYRKEPAVKRLAFYRHPGKQTVNYSGIVQYNPGYAGFHQTLFNRKKPDRDAILALLPDNNVIHLWINVFDSKKIWSALCSSGKNIYIRALVRNLEEWIAVNTEYSMDEFLSLFGSQISLNVAEMKSSGIFPMPRLSLCIEVRDRDKVRALLDNLFAGLQVRQTTVGGKEIHSVILAGGLMQPSYMFHHNFLVVADNKEQLELLLSGEKNTLLLDPLFKKVDVGLTEANNVVLYFRNAEMIDGLKELVRWYGSLLQLFDNQPEEKNRVILEKIILPVLEGMKMYQVKSFRVYTTDAEMIMRTSQLPEKE
ncbi:MAG: hypothetical protein SCH71_03505 [Desulfobulbaceae bacterium]|nr:hypothetical protein [Desulfobulbaceae bacterium]